MKNKFRGEVALNFANKTIIIRPSFAALMEIESHLGKSILQMLLDFPEQKLKLAEIMAIIKAGSKAYGNELSDEALEAMLEGTGVVSIMPALVEFLRVGIGDAE